VPCHKPFLTQLLASLLSFIVEAPALHPSPFGMARPSLYLASPYGFAPQWKE